MSPRSGTNKRQRTRVLSGRFNDQEVAAIQRTGQSLAALVRQQVLKTPAARAVRRPTVDHQAVARILAQLGKIGSNINQLAHHANAGRPMDRMSNNLELALRDLAELRHACLHALGQEPERPSSPEP